MIADLCVTRLETRRVLNGDAIMTELVVDAGSAANDGQTDTFHIQAVQDRVQVSLNGEVVSSAPLHQLRAITLRGSADDDIVIADLNNDALAGVKLIVEAGHGTDVLRLINDAPVNTINHSLDTPGSGQADIATAQATTSLHYHGLEHLQQTLSTNNLTLQFGSGADTIILGDAPSSGENQLIFSHALDEQSASPSPFTLTFANPLDVLRLDTDRRDTATADEADRIQVTGLDSSFDANFILQGDHHDSLLFTGHTAIGGGNLQIASGEIDIRDAIQTSQATISITAT
ncbi:MAG: hypothetical protein KDA45_13420, partial [Planctomycetales bacterium]|nr:hypothetical protein [Planctomycetales bacterium]